MSRGRRAGWLVVMAAVVLAVGCAPADPTPEIADASQASDAATDVDLSPESAIVRGNANVWLTSSGPVLAVVQGTPTRPFVVIEGMVTDVAADASPAAGRSAFFTGLTGPTHALIIRTDDGVDWTLGHRLERGDPAVDVTPNLQALLGSRVKLLFRAIRAFGTAPGFVLFDERGVVYAVDRAVYGDPLEANDVPGLKIEDGTAAATTAGFCFTEEHRRLVFRGDQPVEVPPGGQGTVNIAGNAYTALSLLNLAPASNIQCTDVAGALRIWALWRER